MLSKYIWGNIAQENYLCNVGLEHTYILSQENLWKAVTALSEHFSLFAVI